MVSLNQSFSQPNWTYQGDGQSKQHQPTGYHQHQLVAFRAVGGLNVGWGDCGEFNQNLNLWETKQIEKTHVKENNYTHKTIFTWFGNLPTSTKLQGFHYKIRRYNSALEHSQETQIPITP